MSKFSARNVGTQILIGFLVLVAIICYAGAAVVHDDTLVAWWIPALVSFVLAAASGLTMWRLWKRLTSSGKILPNYICHVIFAGGIFLLAFYSTNYVLSRESTAREETAVVEKKFTKTRHHRQRVSRRVYRQGSPYKVYYFDLRFDNGKEKTVNVSSRRYNRTRSGSQITTNVETGFFGIPVIKDNLKN